MNNLYYYHFYMNDAPSDKPRSFSRTHPKKMSKAQAYNHLVLTYKRHIKELSSIKEKQSAQDMMFVLLDLAGFKVIQHHLSFELPGNDEDFERFLIVRGP